MVRDVTEGSQQFDALAGGVDSPPVDRRNDLNIQPYRTCQIKVVGSCL